MPLYKLIKKENEYVDMKELEKKLFKKVGIKENDLQKILKQDKNIESLVSKDSGPMIIIGDEFKVSKKRIDLLAIEKIELEDGTTEANLVVIELKRTEDAGHAELQAIRYAAMVSTMTWEKAVEAYEKYIEENPDLEKDPEEAEGYLLEFLEWKEAQEDNFNKDNTPRIILASEDFSTEITTSVLWLNEQGLDITCIRLSLHEMDDEKILSTEQIIPLPEAEKYLEEAKSKLRAKKQNEGKRRSKTRLINLGIANETTLYFIKDLNITATVIDNEKNKIQIDGDVDQDKINKDFVEKYQEIKGKTYPYSTAAKKLTGDNALQGSKYWAWNEDGKPTLEEYREELEKRKSDN